MPAGCAWNKTCVALAAPGSKYCAVHRTWAAEGLAEGSAPKCWRCKGTGDCPACGGGGDYGGCPVCRGEGFCPSCEGEGNAYSSG